MAELKTLYRPTVTFGCDPEVFFVKKGTLNRKYPVVVGAEKVLPKNGHVVPDGVQAELHPGTAACRANLGNYMKSAMASLQTLAKKHDLDVCFRSVVNVRAAELATLSIGAQQLGCMPSLNIYGRPHIQTDGMKYRKRSAAGHIHIGSNLIDRGVVSQTKAAYIPPSVLVPLLDILVGLPSVMIDRDPGNVERRKKYGKAGEYRLPAHGLEYRTLSNFWLRDYKLFSLVLGQARTAFYLASGCALGAEERKKASYYYTKPDWDAGTRVLEAVSLPNVEKAINTNDLTLALSEFEKVKPILSGLSIGDGINNQVTGHAHMWPDWDYFISKPLEHWFPKQPLESWLASWEGHGNGWESFFWQTVHIERMKAEAKTVKVGAKP